MQDAQTIDRAEESRFLFLRSDTLLGVCHAIGDSLGFNPTWLRAALCAALFWNPAAVTGAYVALGFVVLWLDWLYPRSIKNAPAASAQPAAATAEEGEPERERELIAA